MEFVTSEISLLTSSINVNYKPSELFISKSEERLSLDQKNFSGISYIMGGSTGIDNITGIKTKQNQDSFCFQTIEKITTLTNYYNNETSEVIISSEIINLKLVTDGHGLLGKVVSEKIINKFPEIIISNLDMILSEPDNPIILKQLFINFNNDEFYEEYKIKAGGSTCTVIIDTDKFTICANVGDCESFINYETTDTVSNHIKRITIDGVPSETINNQISLTYDQSLHNEDEVKRLLNIGSHINIRYSMRDFDPRIDRYQDRIAKELDVWERITSNQIDQTEQNDKIITLDDGSIVKYVDSSKQIRTYHNNMRKQIAIYVHNDRNGICSNCPRSFGDSKNEYVIPEPTITVVHHPTIDGKKIPYKIVTGSDGFFNCFTDEELSELLLLNTEEIIQNVYKKVGATFGYRGADNTTICILTKN